MAKRKTAPRSSNRKSKRRNSKKKNLTTSWNTKILSIAFSAFLLTVISGFFKHDLVNLWANYHRVTVKTGDYGMQLIHEALNLQHSIRENPNNKEKLQSLLADRVVWFRKNHKVSKSGINTYSFYDQFHFASIPTYSDQNVMMNNYQMNFIGFHRFRRPDSLYVKIENYYAEINNGKINEIYSVPISEVDEQKIGRINSFYRYFYIVMFVVIVVIVIGIQFITTLPEAIFKNIIEIAKRFIPI